MMLRRSFTVLLLAFAPLLASTAAFAQSESDKATARALGQQGAAALDGSNWKDAEDYFRRADSLFHAPTLVLGLARAQAHQGKFVEAWESYHRIVIDDVTSPPVFAKALADATSELASVEGQRARLTITVTGAESPRVIVNDVPLKTAALGVARFVNPGHLIVTVAGDGVRTESRAVDLAPGKEDAVAITLAKDPGAPVAATAAPPALGSAEAPRTSGSILKPLGFGALAVGGAGLVLGAVTGGLALGKHGDLKTACPNGACDTSSSQSTLSSYHTLGTLSTVGFVLGGAGIGGGIALLLVAPKSEPKPAPVAAVAIVPYLGFGIVGATGTF